MRVIVIVETSQSGRVAAVCEDWYAAEQEKKRLSGIYPEAEYHLIERTLTKRSEY